MQYKLGLKNKPEVAVEKLAQIRYLTRCYQDLQGYRLLPFVLLFLLTALQGPWLRTVTNHTPGPDLFSFWLMTKGVTVTLFIVAVFASHLIGRWYEERYGLILPEKDTKLTFSRRTYLIGSALWLTGALLFGDNGGLGLLSLWLIWSVAPRSLPRLHHVPPAILYAFLAGALNATPTGITYLPEFQHQVLISRSLGAAAILLVAAIWNHRQLAELSQCTADAVEEA